MNFRYNLNKLRNILTSEQKNYFNLFVFLSVMAMILEIVSISLIIPLINILIDGNSNIPFFDLNYIVDNNLFSILILFLLIFSIKNLFLAIFEKKKFYFLYKLRISISEKVFKYYLNKDYLFHLNNNSSILVRNINDIGLVLAIIRSWIILLSEVIIILGITIFLFYFNPSITIFSFIFLTSLGYFFHWNIQNKAKKWGEDRQKHDGYKLIKITEGFGSIKDIKLSNKDSYFVNQFSNHNKSSAISEYYHSYVLSLPRLIFEWLLVFCVVCLVFIIVKKNQNYADVLSILSVFLVSALRFMPSITRIMNCLQFIKYSGPALDVVAKILIDIHLVASITKKEENNQFTLKDKIKIKNISFSFSTKKKPILNNISFEIEAGTKIGIIGESGTGKTTFINILTGLLTPSSGEILIDGKNILLNVHKWQSIIGYVPQNIFLLDDTLIKNIAFGFEDNDIDMEKIQSTINLVKLTKLINKSQKQLYLKVGELGDNLSGGEKQRLGIARAIYKDPQILILDESTSSLDLATETEIIRDIFNAMKNKTIIIISHRKSTLELCDKVFKLENNSLVKL